MDKRPGGSGKPRGSSQSRGSGKPRGSSQSRGSGKPRGSSQSRGSGQPRGSGHPGNRQNNHPPVRGTSKSRPSSAPADKDTPTESDIVHWILQRKNGTCEVHQLLSEYLQAVSVECFLEKSRGSTCLFIIPHQRHPAKSIIKAYSPRARLCFSYYMHGKCASPTCKNFHLCASKIQQNNCNCSGIGNCLALDHNTSVIKARSLQGFTQNELLRLCWNSFLTVCLAHNSLTGCLIGNEYAFCPFIHICEKFVRGCCPDSPCRFGHSLDLFHHNDLLMEKFGFKLTSPNFKKILLKCLLVPDTNNVFRMITSVLIENGKLGLSLQQLSQATKVIEPALLKHMSQLHEVHVVAMKFYIRMNEFQTCFFHNLSLGCKRENCPFFHICRKFISGVPHSEPCTSSHDLGAPRISQLFEQKVRVALTIEQRFNVLRNSALRLCPMSENCRMKQCLELHLCQGFIRKTCDSESCPRAHSFSTDHNRKVLNCHGFNVNQLPAERTLSNLVVLCHDDNRPQHSGQRESRAPVKNPGRPASASRSVSRTSASSETSSLPFQSKNQKKKSKKGAGEQQKQVEEPNTEQPKKAAPKAKTKPQKANQNNEERKEGSVDKLVPSLMSVNVAEMPQENPSTIAPSGQGKKKARQQKAKQNSNDSKVGVDGSSPSVPVYTFDHDDDAMDTFLKEKCKISETEDDVQYVWRWLDEDGTWYCFGEEDAGDGIQQDLLEARYQDYLLGESLGIVIFEMCQQFYEISFSLMTQKNMETQKLRYIERREFNATLALNHPNLLKKITFDKTRLPKADTPWFPMDTENELASDIIALKRESAEFREVEDHFFQTLSRKYYQINRVYRVQNLNQWTTFEKKRNEMKSRLGEEFHEEQLFHGTPDFETVFCICNQSFDCRVSGVHGTLYGDGAYFSKSASYGNNFTQESAANQQRFMFRGSVLVGRFTKGSEGLRRPPALADRHRLLYDSVVDDPRSPSIFVIFQNDQAYPKHLIEYKEKPSADNMRPESAPMKNLQESVPCIKRNAPSDSPNEDYAHYPNPQAKSSRPLFSGPPVESIDLAKAQKINEKCLDRQVQKEYASAQAQSSHPGYPSAQCQEIYPSAQAQSNYSGYPSAQAQSNHPGYPSVQAQESYPSAQAQSNHPGYPSAQAQESYPSAQAQSNHPGYPSAQAHGNYPSAPATPKVPQQYSQFYTAPSSAEKKSPKPPSSGTTGRNANGCSVM